MECDDFKTKRRYSSIEVAQHLGTPKTWIKDGVTLRCIPFQMSGLKKGVWFTYDDIHQIGGMLPRLMTERQANACARANRVSSTPPVAGEPTVADALPSGVVSPALGHTPSAADLARFRQLRTLG